MSVTSSFETWCVVALCVAALSTAADAAPTCGQPIADGSRTCIVPSEVDPLARCNDGTQPVFWVRPGSGAGLSRWVIWLEGGSQCFDQASCAARARSSGSLVTSNGFAAQPGTGVLSSDPSDNPLLYNANAVLVHYCSSDDWSGNQASDVGFNPADAATWNFQGRRIVLASIATLRELGLNFAGAHHILFGGSSAGGLGVTVTANDVLPTLPETGDVRVVNDAGFALDIGQFDPRTAAPYVYPGVPNAFDMSFASGIKLWRGTGDAKCNAAAQTQQERIACYSSQVFSKGYIDAPIFVAESQLDLIQLIDEICSGQGSCSISHNPLSKKGRYAGAFAGLMAQALIGSGKPAYSVFSPDFYMHTMLTDATAFTAQYTFAGGTLSPRTVFDAWLLSGGSPRIVDIGSGPGVSGAVLPSPAAWRRK